MPKPHESDFDEIYRLYARYIYRYILSLSSSKDIAEELTDETFCRAVKNINRYKKEYPLPVWLKAIAKNLYTDCLRKKSRTDVTLCELDCADSTDTEILIEDKEQAMSIHKALHTLEEPYKEVFSLRIFGELSYKEIGSIFSMTDGWARTVFFRAKEKIINKLKEQE